MWKDVKDKDILENYYEVSPDGKLRRKKDKFIYIYRSSKHNNYIALNLFDKNKKRKRFLLHRLIAQTYIDNPDNLPIINHIDEDTQNNCVENLEWCTQKTNMQKWHYNRKLERIRKKIGKES